ncbi:MAG: MBL fold metallo-hydrolase [Trebonia sp.]
MKVTWLGHAGIRIDQDGYTLVVDPGVFCDKAALDSTLADADGVLITHEHPDHFAADRVKAALAAKPGIEVWTNSSVAALLDGAPAAVHTVGDGDAFAPGGIGVHAYGEWHAVIHRDLRRVLNSGFLIGGKVFHPGDALTLPQAPVDLLLLPAHGPWTKTGDLLDYVREVKPGRVSPIHDAMLSPVGNGFVDGFLTEKPGYGPGTGAPYARMTLAESFDL